MTSHHLREKEKSMTDLEGSNELEIWGLNMCRALVRAAPDEDRPLLRELSDVVGMKLRLVQHFSRNDFLEIVIMTISGVRVRAEGETRTLIFSIPVQTVDINGNELQQMLGLACTFSGDHDSLRMSVVRYFLNITNARGAVYDDRNSSLLTSAV